MSYKHIDQNTNTSLIDFVIFDLETTGLSIGKDKIVEIGAIKCRDRKIIGVFSDLINPQIPIPQESTNITGINDDMVKNKDSLEKVLQDFLPFIENCILVGHNIKKFDVPFIKQSASECNMGSIENQLIDTWELARKKFPKLKSYKLQDLVENFGFEKNNAHRALDDCYSCMKLFNECLMKGSFMSQMPILKEILD